MKPELQQIFDNTLEDDPPRSKLEPYCELILRWRRQGRTYRRICGLLADRCGVTITCGALCRFVKRRSRPRKLQAQPEAQSGAELIAPLRVYGPAEPKQLDLPSANSPQIASTDKYAADRERMRRHKAEPIAPEPQKRFSYTDEDCLKPL